MITAETIQVCAKEDVAALAAQLSGDDIAQLVAWLSEKDDNFRYTCFLLLQARSETHADVYPYWDMLADKLNSPNSYQRSIGLMLMAENARWDGAGKKFDAILDRYLTFCDDEKPITVRQCIQSLGKIAPHKPACHAKIVEKLTAIDLMQRKETQRKLLLMDILGVLCVIRKRQPDARIEAYLQRAMTGEILDSKSKRLVAAM